MRYSEIKHNRVVSKTKHSPAVLEEFLQSDLLDCSSNQANFIEKKKNSSRKTHVYRQNIEIGHHAWSNAAASNQSQG